MTCLDADVGTGAVGLTAVRKQFGDHVVLDGIDLDVRSGSRVALIGPSGSGKTTVLRCVATLEPVDGGTVSVDGVAINTAGMSHRAAKAPRVAAARRRIGMVFQQFNLFPNLRVLDNVTLAPRRVLGADRAAAELEAADLLEQVGLPDKAEAFPHQLSGGQQQRVAIARALAMHPAVMLFDEVTSALDPELVGEVLTVIRSVAEQSSVTMLIVTHEMHFAADVADRVVFMEGGRVVEQGPPDEVLRRPVHERTQRFLRRLHEH